MANTKNTKSTQNKTGKASSSGNSRSRSGRKSKNSSDDTLKFLLVLVIAGIAIALIFFSQDKEEQTGNVLTGTPAPTNAAVTQAVQPTEAPQPTRAQEQNTPVPTPTSAPVEEPTSTPEPTATSTPAPTATPTPTPALSAAEAEELVHSKVDTSVYNIQLVSESLRVGNGSYYQFGAIANQEFVYPFLVVDKATGELSCYDSTAETVFDFTTFPIKGEATPTPVPTKAPEGRLTAEEAYQVLCTYSRESLHIAKAVSEYDAEYGSELTLIDGVDCYRINLSEFSNGKVRNRGEFYVSVDGTKCFYIDSNTNEFIKAEK
ncbi:MAG: hypothetical protein J6J42_14440 [Lachnospiraceae bacterium]|nr:hypothetical protein [Lachnospiraceae bacterium]